MNFARWTNSLATVPLSEALVRAQRLISTRTGVINRVEFVLTSASAPRIYWARAIPASTIEMTEVPALNAGNATSYDPERAAMKAIGESIERYCAAFYDRSQFVVASFEDLDDAATDPAQFALYTPDQYQPTARRFTPFTSKTKISWVCGYSLSSGKPTYVPAQFVYVPYRCCSEERSLSEHISTGLASSTSAAVALQRSILEIIERDAFMIWWQNCLPSLRINLTNQTDEIIVSLLAAGKTMAFTCDAFFLPSDFRVAVVLVVFRAQDGRVPMSVVGLGTDFDANTALKLALEEAYLGLLGMSSLA